MADNSKALAYYIVKHLQQVRDSGAMSPEQNDSLEVAAQCLMDVYSVDPQNAEHRTLFNDNTEDTGKAAGKSRLQSMYDNQLHNSAKSSSSSYAAAPAANIIVTDKDRLAAEALKARGNALMKEEKYREAIDTYTRAGTKDPYNPVYPSNRSVAHTKLGMHAEAAADARAAIAIDARFSKAYSRLGCALFALEQYDESAAAYRRGLKLDPNNSAMRQSYESARKLCSNAYNSDENENDNDDDNNNNNNSLNDCEDVEEEYNHSRTNDDVAGGNSRAGGMPDFSSLLKNPQLMRAAQDMMAKNPGLVQMAQQFAAGSGSGSGSGSGAGGFDMSRLGELMNNPDMMNMAQQMMGSRGGAGASGANSGAKRGGSSSGKRK